MQQCHLDSISLEAEHTNLGHQYEFGNVAALRYGRDNVPGATVLASALVSPALLGRRPVGLRLNTVRLLHR